MFFFSPDFNSLSSGDIISYDFKNINRNLFEKFLREYNWDKFWFDKHDLLTVNNGFDIFYSVIKTCINNCIPRKIRRILSGPIWYERLIRKHKNRKSQLQKRYKQTFSFNVYHNYNLTRKLFYSAEKFSFGIQYSKLS